MSKLIATVGILFIVVGMVAMIYLGNTNALGTGLLVFIAAAFSGVMILGFSQIIESIQNIETKICGESSWKRSDNPQ